jgi:hypothetical protein
VAQRAETAKWLLIKEAPTMTNELLTKADVTQVPKPIDATLKSINDRFDLFERRLTFNLGVVMVASVVFWSAVFKLL